MAAKKIIIERRDGDIMARIKPAGRYGTGFSARAAVGDLVLTHPEVFGVKFEWPKGDTAGSDDWVTIPAGWYTTLLERAGEKT